MIQSKQVKESIIKFIKSRNTSSGQTLSGHSGHDDGNSSFSDKSIVIINFYVSLPNDTKDSNLSQLVEYICIQIYQQQNIISRELNLYPTALEFSISNSLPLIKS